jgi:hypothetical protein
MQTVRFEWFIFISVIIHTLLFPLFHFVRFHEPKLFLPIEVGLVTMPPSSKPESFTQPDQARRATAHANPVQRSTPTKPLTPSITKAEAPSPGNEPSPREIEPSVAPGGTSPGTGIILPGSEGAATGVGAPGTTGTSSGTGNSSTGTKEGSSGSGSSTGRRSSSTGSERDPFTGVEIPGYVIDAAGFRSHDQGGIYPEMDVYILYGIDKRIGIPVPGNEVCIEGDQIRTKATMTITEVKTDYSKCRVLEFGDENPPKIVCPSEAQTRIVHSDAYASSPLVYTVRTCLEYDQSNCHDAEAAADGSREVCTVDFQYEGVWAEGTIFAYKCTKSEVRTYRHPLQYTIRYLVHPGLDSDHGSFKPREVYRESVPVERCR